jgi:hypothetical protein
MGLGSILILPDKNLKVNNLEEYSNQKLVFRNSQMFLQSSSKTNNAIKQMDYNDYKTMQSSYQSFMTSICLSCENMHDIEVIKDFSYLKKWVYRTSPKGIDLVTSYLKWLNKVCQALFLRAPLPERLSTFPNFNGKETPFNSGEFRFIGQMILEGGRTGPLTLREANILAQISAGSRSLPYPSNRQIIVSIQETCDIISQKADPIEDAYKTFYLKGLDKIFEDLGPIDKHVSSHVSLTNSACYELPQSEGGRGAWIASHCHKFCDILVTGELLEQVKGKFDSMGKMPIKPIVATIAESVIN